MTMTDLTFTLLPDALIQLHDVLVCLAKFSESVSIEAGEAFALLSVFKGRVNDFKDRETAIERCEVRVQDGPDEAECRFVVRMICRHGVVKTYKLTYEAVEIQHAIFDKSKTENQWAIDSKFLREIIDHFSPSAEQLDVFSENHRAVFTSFTTKVVDGKEILKQPVHTSVAIDTKDFDQFMVEDKLHVAINVKDFKAIVIHAYSLRGNLVARYTRPCRPMQISYEANGMVCEFTLMTRGEAGETPSTSANGNRELSARPYSRPVQVPSRDTTAAPPPTIPETVPRTLNTPQPPPPPSQPQTGQEGRDSPPLRPSIPIDPLFVPADDDQQWDEPNYGDEDEDMLGWDVSMNQDEMRASVGTRLQDITPTGASMRQQNDRDQGDSVAIPPTQRISQIRGLFD
ncbi:hypothetical protein FQN55_003517 [Onygenales sp. PD_40]|nr:hypothetical protein FQN55_003517 [Onygenales sp. PD_40]